MLSLEEHLAIIHRDLAIEEQRGPANGVTDIALRMGERKAIRARLALIAKEIRSLKQRLRRLPVLPGLKSIRWAQSVLACPNSCILVVDTDASGSDAAVMHVLILDCTESVLFDALVAPGHIVSRQTMRILGVAAHDFHEAPSLPQIWLSFLATLTGRYIVSYDLNRIRLQLEANAKQYDLEPPTIIGDCLLKQCLHYFRSLGSLRLAMLCESIGHPLPELPDQTAIDRAVGQLRLLQAMSQGISGAGQTPLAYELFNADDEDDLYNDLDF
jgi:hypothetical protein